MRSVVSDDMGETMPDNGDKGVHKHQACPLCGQPIKAGVLGRCASCGMDTAHPAIATIRSVDNTWARYAEQYERLAAKWDALRAKREGLIAELMATRTQGSFPVAEASPTVAVGEAHRQDESDFSDVDDPFAAPGAPAVGGLPRGTRPTPVRKTPRKLTVPNAFGVSGAALIITAVILYIAVAWETFVPLALGSMILVTAALTALLGWWLTHIQLPISGGAVGVIASAIAGLSALGYDRGSGILGAYEVPTAAAVAALSGVGLSRLGLRWVGSSASLALMIAVVSGTIARTSTEQSDRPAALALSAAMLGGAALATYPLWRSREAQAIVRWSGWAWVSLGANTAAWSLTDLDATWARFLGAGLGVAVLVAAARAWPKTTLPAAVAAVVGAGATIGFDIGSAWHAATGAAVSVVIVSVAAMLVAKRFRSPLTWSLWGGAAIVAVTAIGAAVAGVRESLRVWDPTTEVDTIVDAGIAAAAGAMALAIFERVLHERAGRVTASVVGAVAAAVGLVALAFAVLRGSGLSPTMSVVISLVAGALATTATIPLWTTSAAKWTAGIGAVFHTTLAGAVAIIALANNDEPIVRGVVAAAIPVLALVAFGVRWPRPTLPSAAAILTSVGAAIPAAYERPEVLWLAGAVAVVAVLTWVGNVLPRSHALPIMLGLSPAGTLGAVVIVLGAATLAAIVLADFDTDMRALDPANLRWWMLGAAVGVLVAAFGVRRFVRRNRRTGVELVGALATLSVGVYLSAGVIHEWYPYEVPATAGATVGAIATATLLWIWRSRAARWTAGIGSVVWLTAAHVRGFSLYADGSGDLAHWVAILVGTVALLVIAGIWWPRVTGGPAALLVTFGAFATAHSMMGGIRALATLAIAIAVVAWVAALLGDRRAFAVRLGLIPAAVVIVAHIFVVWGGEYTVEGHDRWWEAGLLAATFATTLSIPELRRWAVWMSLPFAFTAAFVSPALVAWLGLVAVAALLVAIGPRAVSTAPTALVYVIGASIWAGQESGWLAIATGVTVVLAYVVARRYDAPERTWALVVGPVALGLSLGAALVTVGVHTGVAVGAALLAATGAAFASTLEPFGLDVRVSRVQTGVFTALAPLFAEDLGAAGWIVIAGALVWLTIAVRGWDAGKWIFAGGMALGPTLVAADAELGVVEAYSVVPAAAFIGLGLWELAHNPRQRTFAALAPGLAVALVPSIVALGVDVNNLARTLWLTGAVLICALWGVAARWFAPVLATLVGAVWVSLTQAFAGTELVPRWLSVLFVGAIVLVTGTTYERLKELR